jgi:hypothetical protein
MGHSEGDAGERARRFVAVLLVSTDPVFPLVSAAHVSPAAADCVPANRLIPKSLSFGYPIPQIAGFKIQIQGTAIGGTRQMTHLVVSRRPTGGLTGSKQYQRENPWTHASPSDLGDFPVTAEVDGGVQDSSAAAVGSKFSIIVVSLHK